jgi:hypothetical protein
VSAEPVVVVAWLVVAHLVADFVLQTGRIAADKQGDGRRARRALLDHALGVAVCLLPTVLAFGVPAVPFLILVALSHALLDRTKVLLNRRAERRALDEALARYGTLVGSGGLGTAWTPVPAALFVVDQLAHSVVSVALWTILLRDAPLTSAWASLVAFVAGGIGPAEARALGLGGAVVISLAIVNVRAASLLIGTLVSPREVSHGQPPIEPRPDPTGEDADADRDAAAPDVAPSEAIVRMRIGPLEIRSSTATAAAPRPEASAAAARHVASAPAAAAAAGPTDAGPARIGEAIGVLERLLVVVFVLTGSLAAIGFVVAAKTLARFKQLDDRAFAEYYLLGTLASVSVALVSAILAALALGIPLKG